MATLLEWARSVAVRGAHVATGRPAFGRGRAARVCLHVLRHPNMVNAVAFSLRGDEVVTGCADGVVRCFAVGSGQLTRELRGRSGGVLSVASLSPRRAMRW